jgi:hypothetical protein
MKYILLIYSSFILNVAYAQTKPEIVEGIIKKQVNHLKILSFGLNRKWNDIDKIRDSISIENRLIMESLLKYTEGNIEVLNYPFISLQRTGIKIASSSDSNFRIYSWDNELGDSLRYFYSVAQFKVNGHVYSLLLTDTSGKVENSISGWYSSIYPLKAKLKTYYLGICNFVLSSKYYATTIELYELSDHVVDRAAIFVDPDHRDNGVTFNFDYDKRLISYKYYNPITKELRIPIMKDYKFIKNFKVYKFNGSVLEFSYIE